MAKIKIQGEQPFQIIQAHSFGISPSKESYALYYSADGINYTKYDKAVPADENCFVLNVPKFCYFKLVGNKSDVIINC